MGFQVNGNTFIDNTGSAIFNANTSVANNFSVQLTPFASRESTSPMQGTVAGFTAGGNDESSPPVESNVVDKFLFSNELTATDVGDLSVAKRNIVAGQSSQTDGYASGGRIAPGADISGVDKYSFTSFVTATDIGDLTVAREDASGQSSLVSGYSSGGNNSTPPTPPNGQLNTIDKFPFSVDTNASDVGDLTENKSKTGGCSSENDGYTAGGDSNPGELNKIEKFPFASDTNATDIGDVIRTRRHRGAQSSKTHGYLSGGDGDGGSFDVIQKFPFAVDTNSSDVGDLVAPQDNGGGSNSREHGYVAGGQLPAASAMIQRFPFATDTNASDVGSLSIERSASAGAQD